MAATIIDFFVVILVLFSVLNGMKLIKIFLSIYLPLLIFFPSEFVSTIAGLPHTNPAQTAILALGGIFILTYSKHWTFSYMDSLILLYLALYNYSEWTAEMDPKGERTVVNELTASLTQVLFPYMLAKTLIGLHGFHVAFAQRLIYLVFLVSILMPYELRFTFDPFYAYLGRIYDFGAVTPPLMRYGFIRYIGPFTHAILAGAILSTCLLLDLWLIRNKLWERMGKFYISTIFTFIGLALIATSSRAPYIGFGMGYIFSGLGYNMRHRWRSLLLRLGVVAVFTCSVYFFFSSYFDINTETVSSESQATLEYRVDLIPAYSPIVEERFWLGWGNLGWPKLSGVVSIDNHYLWLALRHGTLTLGVFIIIALFIVIKLFWWGMTLKGNQKLACSLIFTLFAIFVMQLLIFYTVYMGGQTTALFFILLGWSEGLLLYLQATSEDIPSIQITRYNKVKILGRV